MGKPSDFATRTPGKAPPRKPNNSYERGVPVDSRGMPVLTANGDYMRQKEHDRKRHLIEETRRRRLNTGVI